MHQLHHSVLIAPVLQPQRPPAHFHPHHWWQGTQGWVALLLFVAVGLLFWTAARGPSVSSALATPSANDVCPWLSGAQQVQSEEFLSPLGLPPANEAFRDTTHLIVVPGHAVFVGRDIAQWRDSRLWALEPFQRGNGDLLVACFAEHMRRALELLASDVQRSLVVFSGGQSRPGAGPRSEGFSYYSVAEETSFFGLFAAGSEPRDRIVAEEVARDSYENVLFSIARFKEVTGHYPRDVTVVGWAYKRDRFVQLHRAALRFPAAHFAYEGLDMKDIVAIVRKRDGSTALAGAAIGKVYSDRVTFDRDKSDVYLCRVNAATRTKRNPQRRGIPYFVTCPELSRLLAYCGPTLIAARDVPWGGLMAADEQRADELMIASLQKSLIAAPQRASGAS